MRLERLPFCVMSATSFRPVTAFTPSKNDGVGRVERVPVAVPLRVLRVKVSQTADVNIVSPFFRSRFTPLDTFIQGPFELVALVAKASGGAAGRVFETPVLFPWRTKALIEIKTGGGEKEEARRIIPQ